MKSAFLCAFLSALLIPQATLAKDNDRSAQQVRLDAECEAARELKLAPEREKYIEECVEKKQKSDRMACEDFYRDYGARSGNRAPLYYDLPECESAFEFRKNKSR